MSDSEYPKLILAIAGGHLTIAAVLASATWASPLAYPFVITYGVWVLALVNKQYRKTRTPDGLRDRIDELEDRLPAADGGSGGDA